jgi:hypothetical protein
LPPWLEITRTLHLGVHWTVETTVRRVSPKGTPVIFRFPLLPGEAVADAGIAVEKGAAVVSLSREATELVWSSTLKPSSALTLNAPRGAPWTEVWKIDCSEIWHCAAKGLPPVGHTEDGQWRPSYRPWPGEHLTVEFVKPKAAPGPSMTIDSASLTLSPGVRLLDAELSMTVRTSQGGTKRIRLPKGARVRRVEVGGKEYPVESDPRALSIALQPGTQQIRIVWQQNGGMSFSERAPVVELGGQVANAQVVINMPPNRWLLWAHGPKWGPAILFWGYLLLVVLAAVALSRAKSSPLRTWQWVLLGLGLTQIPALAAITIVGWLFALEWRRRDPIRHPWAHNAAQVALVIWTIVALVCLFVAVHEGLLVQPDMQVQGSSSSAEQLRWFVDHSEGALPTPSVWSAPMWVYRVLMLLWSSWLAWSLVSWLRNAWKAFIAGGAWRKRPRTPVAKPVVAPPASPPPAQG